MFRYKVQTSFNPQKAHNQLARQLKPQIDARLAKLVTVLETDLRKIVVDAIRSTAEWKSMKGGYLQGALGLDQEALDGLEKILELWADQVLIRLRKTAFSTTKGLSGGVAVRAVESNFKEVIESEFAKYRSVPSGTEIRFMAMLLTEGKATIDGFALFVSSFFRDISRSALAGGPPAIMMERDGASYTLPTEFAGVKGNNFVTKALNSVAGQIKQTIARRAREIL